MKIIFLDIDGVLCFPQRPVDGYFRFDKECLKNLKKILRKTNARIVLSSTWRILNSQQRNYELELGYKLWSIYHLGRTPLMPGAGREMEIFQRLDEASKSIEVKSWIAIDDDIGDMQIIHEMGRLVKCDTRTGLTEELADKAIELLNN